jgi:hypothetical protein
MDVNTEVDGSTVLEAVTRQRLMKIQQTAKASYVLYYTAECVD